MCVLQLQFANVDREQSAIEITKELAMGDFVIRDNVPSFPGSWMLAS